MRLLKIGVYYSTYLEQFYAQHPDIAGQSFSAQHAALMHDCFGSSDFWTAALTTLGYQTCDTVANAEPLQKMWASEQGISFDPAKWLFDISAAQIKSFQPDVLLVADYSTITAEFLRHIKRVCPSIRLVLGWCGAPYHDGSVFSECDIVLSCVPELVTHFQESGHSSRHVNHAFDCRVLERIDASATPSSDFVFLGSIIKSDRFHISREKLLSRLVKETNLRIWSDLGSSTSATPDTSDVANREQTFANSGASRWRRQVSSVPLIGAVARGASRFISGGGNGPVLSPLTVDPQIVKRSEEPLFGLRMFQQLHDSRVALNTHIDISPINASNMRLFEATGVGSCLLTDWKANLSELFEPDSEVVTYRDADECIEKAKYLLAHESERRSIAAAGQKRALRDHTFEHRAARIDSIIREALK